MAETGPERKPGIPKIVSTTARWLRVRWNEVYYGFPGGKAARARMEELLNQDRLGPSGRDELLGIFRQTSSGRWQYRIAEKISDDIMGESIEQLADRRIN